MIREILEVVFIVLFALDVLLHVTRTRLPRLHGAHRSHREVHMALHCCLDELIADYLRHNRDAKLRDSSIMNLVKWSHRQTIEPTETADEARRWHEFEAVRPGRKR